MNDAGPRKRVIEIVVPCKHLGQAEFGQLRRSISDQIHLAEAGVVLNIECCESVAEDSVVGLFDLQQVAASQGKRFALFKIKPSVLATLMELREQFPVHCYGTAKQRVPAPEKSRSAGLSNPQKQLGFNLKRIVGPLLVGMVGLTVVALAALNWPNSRADQANSGKFAGSSFEELNSSLISGTVRRILGADNFEADRAARVMVVVDAKVMAVATCDASGRYAMEIRLDRAELDSESALKAEVIVVSGAQEANGQKRTKSFLIVLKPGLAQEVTFLFE